jgi:glycogen synthase
MDDSDIFQTSRTLKSALRRGIRSATVVTGCSAFTLADAEHRFGLEAGRGMVIFNGVDVAGIHTGPDTAGEHRADGVAAADPLATSELAPSGRPYILALGRVVEKKGFDLLLAAYAGMGEPGQSIDLVIGGAGPALESLQSSAQSLGVADRVHFVGRLSRSQVANFMGGAEIFVMPSRLEPFGIVVLEGWRAGTAVVATTKGGPPEFVRDGVDGVLVDPFDSPAFSAALARLVSDDDWRQSVAAAGLARVREFAWPAIAEQYRTVYSSLATGERPDQAMEHELSSPPREESVQ